MQAREQRGIGLLPGGSRSGMAIISLPWLVSMDHLTLSSSSTKRCRGVYRDQNYWFRHRGRCDVKRKLEIQMKRTSDDSVQEKVPPICDLI